VNLARGVGDARFVLIPDLLLNLVVVGQLNLVHAEGPLLEFLFFRLVQNLLQVFHQIFGRERAELAEEVLEYLHLSQGLEAAFVLGPVSLFLGRPLDDDVTLRVLGKEGVGLGVEVALLE